MGNQLSFSPIHIDHGTISFVVSQYRQVKGNRRVQSSKLCIQAMVA